MVTDKNTKIRNRKREKVCQSCGKLSNGSQIIHVDCALEYIKKQGYEVFRSPLYEVLRR